MNISKQFAAQIRDARARFKARNDIANNTKLRLFTPLTGYIEAGRAYTAAFAKIGQPARNHPLKRTDGINHSK